MNWNNGINKEQVKEPAEGTQTIEERHEENIELQGNPTAPEPLNEEMVDVPLEPMQTVEVIHEENIEWKEQATTPEPMSGNYALDQELVKKPVEETQTMEAKQEENKGWQEQVTTPKAVETGPLPWLKGEENDELRTRWNSIQIEFVNEPRKSVEQADALVAETLERIEQAFSNQRTTLNAGWINHADIATEDLRIALQSYRSFFNRLLAL